MAKGKFSKILESTGLVESNTPEMVHHDPDPSPSTIPAWNGGNTGGTPFSPPSTPFGLAPLSAEDQTRLKALESQVYATQSTYSIFKAMRDLMHGSNDVNQIFTVIKAANPTVTPEKVLRDIDAHLGIIEKKHQEFEQQAAQFKAAKVDGVNQKIAALTKENADLQARLAANGQAVVELQKGLLDAQQSLTNGEATWKVMEGQLRAPLEEAKNLIGGQK